jgi:hypothetical protein
MFSKIGPLFALVASANAHGYLSSPMSRTGLNAQVSFVVTPIWMTAYEGLSLTSPSPVQIPARSAPSLSLLQRGPTSTLQPSAGQALVDTTPAYPSTITSLALAGAHSPS